MSKGERQKIFNKYGGRCAYSGTPLESDWQVDHVDPPFYCVINRNDNPNHIDNLVPCQKILNHYKRQKDLEGWRTYLLSLHIRLAKLPKVTRVERREKYKKYMLKVATFFGISADKPFNGKFYFEHKSLNP